MNFCIYSGTFNPIQTAHLIIAQTIKDEYKFDKIIFIPSFIPPHRENEIAPAEHRMKMVELAITGNDGFEMSDIEFRLEGKSYSYKTIQKIIEEKNIKGKVNFIIGTDAFEKIASWYEASKLVELVKFIVVPRHENFSVEKMLDKIKMSSDKFDIEKLEFEIANVPFMDISSSLVRGRIKGSKAIKYLVKSEVEQYIYKNMLYTERKI